MKKEIKEKIIEIETMIENIENRGFLLKGELSAIKFEILKLENLSKPCRFIEQEWQGIDNYGETRF